MTGMTHPLRNATRPFLAPIAGAIPDAGGRQARRTVGSPRPADMTRVRPSTWAARVHRDPAESYIPVYYKIWIDRVTGHESSRDTRDTRSLAVTASSAGKPGWLRGGLIRLLGGSSK